MEEVRTFYQKLYKAIDDDIEDHALLLESITTPTVDPDLAIELDEPITLQEIGLAIKSMKNNTSPGIDGFPIEFFKFFWSEFKDWIYRYICSRNLQRQQTIRHSQ